MGYKVEVYIYDLTQGMARTLGPAIIGRPLDGVWHTAVVVYGKEFFFGGAGLESCAPGGTMLGAPLRVEDVGQTEITPELFNEYLSNHSRDRFKGDRYDLFRHNCNNFSHETAQFLTGRGIPQYILDLPNEILSTPLGQMLAPMIQQMTPSGNAIPFTMGEAIERTGVPSVGSNFNHSGATGRTSGTGRKNFPVGSPILLDNPLNVDKMIIKLEQLNATETEKALSENELKVFAGLAKGIVRLSKDSFAVVLKVASWKEENRFPALDLLRHKCLHLSGSEISVEELVPVLVSNMAAGDTNAMLAVAALSNLISKQHHKSVDAIDALEKMSELLPSEHKKLEISISTFIHNLSIHLTASTDGLESLELHILILSTILTTLHPLVKQVESEERLLVTLGNILHSKQQEIIDLAHSMDVHQFILKVEPRVKGELVKEVKTMLNISMDGIDLE